MAQNRVFLAVLSSSGVSDTVFWDLEGFWGFCPFSRFYWGPARLAILNDVLISGWAEIGRRNGIENQS